MYTDYLVRGIAESFNLELEHPFPLVRREGHKIQSNDYHNHFYPVSFLTGIVSDNAETKFLNINALDQYIKEHTQEGCIKKTISDDALDAINSVLERRVSGVSIKKEDPIFINFSHGIQAGKGDIILWADDGVLLHRACPAKENGQTYELGEIRRIAGVYLANRGR